VQKRLPYVIALSDRCPVGSVLPCLSVCNVGVLWPNGWMDQDETWHGDRPLPRLHCVRWGPSNLPKKRHSSRPFSAHISLPNGWMDQDATWYKGRPRPRWHCLWWGPFVSDIAIFVLKRDVKLQLTNFDGDPSHPCQKNSRFAVWRVSTVPLQALTRQLRAVWIVE